MQLPDNPNQEQQSDGVGACPRTGQTYLYLFFVKIWSVHLF